MSAMFSLFLKLNILILELIGLTVEEPSQSKPRPAPSTPVRPRTSSPPVAAPPSRRAPAAQLRAEHSADVLYRQLRSTTVRRSGHYVVWSNAPIRVWLQGGGKAYLPPGRKLRFRNLFAHQKIFYDTQVPGRGKIYFTRLPTETNSSWSVEGPLFSGSSRYPGH